MMKSVLICLLCIIILIMPLAGCRTEAPFSEPTTSSTIVPEESENPGTPSPQASVNTPEVLPTSTAEGPYDNSTATPKVYYPSPVSMMDIGEVVLLKDLGISKLSYEVYWAPGKNSIFFQGYTEDAEGKTNTGVFYYDFDRKKINNILTINGDSHYILSEPSWSPDSNEVVFSFFEILAKETPAYVYNISQASLELLPFSAYTAEFSPDSSKIIYTDKDENLWVYTRSTKSSQALGTSVKGRSPVWFSDNRHILFFNATEKNPSNLDGADLFTICIFDTLNMQVKRIIQEEAVYHDIHWILQDRLAWIEWGYDDGHFVSILDLSNNSIEQLGDAYNNRYFTGSEPRIIKSIGQNQWLVRDAVQNRGYEYLSSPYQGLPIGVLPDQTLLLIQTDDNFLSSRMILVPQFSEPQILVQHDNMVYSYVNEDCTRFVFMNPNDNFFIFTDALELFLNP